MPEKRLYRSERNKILAGVCGGIAEYLDVDPVVIRVLFVALVIFEIRYLLQFVLLYIVLALIMPKESGREVHSDRERDIKILAYGLVAIGVLILLSQFVKLSGAFIGLILIAIGVLLVIRGDRL